MYPKVLSNIIALKDISSNVHLLGTTIIAHLFGMSTLPKRDSLPNFAQKIKL
jgi:hypothetical protein